MGKKSRSGEYGLPEENIEDDSNSEESENPYYEADKRNKDDPDSE